VEVVLDFDRRFDHMQQHSGQHLLSAIAESYEYRYETVSWSFGVDRCSVELLCPHGPPNMEQLCAIEKKVNTLIREAIPFTVSVSDPKHDNSDRPSSLPSDVTGVVRVISIGSLDSNPCCGTHVTNTSQLQVINYLIK